MAHSSAEAGKGDNTGQRCLGPREGSPLIPPQDTDARGRSMKILPRKRMLIMQSVKKVGKKIVRYIHA